MSDSSNHPTSTRHPVIARIAAHAAMLLIPTLDRLPQVLRQRLQETMSQIASAKAKRDAVRRRAIAAATQLVYDQHPDLRNPPHSYFDRVRLIEEQADD